MIGYPVLEGSVEDRRKDWKHFEERQMLLHKHINQIICCQPNRFTTTNSLKAILF